MMLGSKKAAGYYHYATGSNESYEETLPKVKATITIDQTDGDVDSLNQNTPLNIFLRKPTNGGGWKMMFLFSFRVSFPECKEFVE